MARSNRNTVTFPQFRNVEITDQISELASTRTAHLGLFAMRKPIAELLHDAYLQGMADAFHVAQMPEGIKALTS